MCLPPSQSNSEKSTDRIPVSRSQAKKERKVKKKIWKKEKQKISLNGIHRIA